MIYIIAYNYCSSLGLVKLINRLVGGGGVVVCNIPCGAG